MFANFDWHFCQGDAKVVNVKTIVLAAAHLLYWMNRFRIKLPGTAVVVFVTTARSTRVLATSEGEVIDWRDANVIYQVK